MAEVARFLVRLILKNESPTAIRNEIASFLESYPINTLHYSLDAHYYTPSGIKLMEEVTA